MTNKPKILFVCHNHPDLHPGGTEIFSHGLFQAMKSQHGLEAVYLACVNTVHRLRLPGTLLQSAGRTPDEILLWAGHFDRFTLSQIDLHGIVPEFERLLRAFHPDVVHFHHVLLMGVEALQVVRRVLPEAGIVLTLHDYYPICANDGQMVTTRDRKLCRSSSADSCVSCFPGTSRDQFVMRELFIKQNLSLVDRFISPSEFLKRRYIEWGLPEDRIDVVRNGIRDAEPAPHRQLPPSGRRDRFAFFGHLNPYKGALVAIEAAKRLAERTDNAISLTLHGSADFQTDDFKAELAKACENTPFAITRGRYARDELPALMADADWVIVPSIWWENAPLIIQEAFQHRRPVICSGIGGMAESVRDGVDGLWFNAGDSRQLADKMAEALDPARWAQLIAGIKTPRKMSEAADEHLALYKEISAARAGMGRDDSMTRVATIQPVEPELPAAADLPVRKEATLPPVVVASAPPLVPAMLDVPTAASAAAAEEVTQGEASVVRLKDFEPASLAPSAAMLAPVHAEVTPDMTTVVPPQAVEPATSDPSTVVPLVPLRDVEPTISEAPATVPVPDSDKEAPDAPTKEPEVSVMDDGRLIDEVDFRSSYRLRRLLRGGGAA